MNEIHKLPLLHNEKIDRLSKTTSFTSIFLEPPPQNITSINSDEGWYISEQENKNKGDDYLLNDLLNDCYDNMPLSNVKKVSGIKSWFI